MNGHKNCAALLVEKGVYPIFLVFDKNKLTLKNRKGPLSIARMIRE